MRTHYAAQVIDRARVQGDKGFIQHPQLGSTDQQPRQRHTSLLALRHDAQRQMRASLQAHLQQGF